MRESEILGLRRSYVHLNEGGITLPAEVTKNDETRFVPLAGDALRIVARRMERNMDYLFAAVGRRNAPAGMPLFPRRAWATALCGAGIPDFRFHDLRHTHGSYLAMTGATTRELMDALGHRTPAMAGERAQARRGGAPACRSTASGEAAPRRAPGTQGQAGGRRQHLRTPVARPDEHGQERRSVPARPEHDLPPGQAFRPRHVLV